MTNKQRNKLAMFRGMLVVLARHQTQWEGKPSFTLNVQALRTQIASIEAEKQKQALSSKGATGFKKESRKKLAEEAFRIGNAVAAHAANIDNPNLGAQVDFTLSDLTYGPEEGFVTKCQKVHDAAAPLSAALADENITVAELTGFQTQITAFKDILTRPRDVRVTVKVATQTMDDQFVLADELLETKLDKQIETFKKGAPAFHHEYRAARIIVDDGTGHSEVPATPVPAVAATK